MYIVAGDYMRTLEITYLTANVWKTNKAINKREKKRYMYIMYNYMLSDGFSLATVFGK